MVMVGVDGSPASDHAIDWAMREAVLRGAELRLLRALPAEDVMAVTFTAPVIPGRADAVLLRARRRAQGLGTAVAITHEMVLDTAGRALVERSLDADLLVVGSRGSRRGFARAVLGSNAIYVAAHSHCPVVIVPAVRDGDAPTAGAVTPGAQPVVVVGYDGSPEACVATGVAADEAALRGATLRVVQAWLTEVVDGSVVTTPDSGGWSRLRDRQGARLSRHLAPIIERHPTLTIERRIVWGSARDVIHDEAGDAVLVVVGNRGRGRVGRAVLGSVSARVLHDATRPVMLVHEAATASPSPNARGATPALR